MSIGRIAAVCLLAFTATGCHGPFGGRDDAAAQGDFGAFGRIGNPLDWGADADEPRKGAPERVVATWVDTVRQTAGQPAERGFGGRLYFYDGGVDPIITTGRLVVYAFDESGRDPTDHKPTRRYVFPAEQLQRHMSLSEVGPSYSVWLPWGGVEGSPTEVSLIARFEPLEGGGLVVSDQATQRLPGQGTDPSPLEERMLAAAKKDTGGVQQAGFSRPSASTNAIPTTVSTKPAAPAEPRRRLSTTTITLPR